MWFTKNVVCGFVEGQIWSSWEVGCTSMMAPTVFKNFQSPQSMYVILALYYSYGALPIHTIIRFMHDDDAVASPRQIESSSTHNQNNSVSLSCNHSF